MKLNPNLQHDKPLVEAAKKLHIIHISLNLT